MSKSKEFLKNVLLLIRDGNPNANAKPDVSDNLGTRIRMRNSIADSAFVNKKFQYTKVFIFTITQILG